MVMHARLGHMMHLSDTRGVYVVLLGMHGDGVLR